jgi:MFS family permease
MASSTILDAAPQQGIRPNLEQFVWLMANTLLVGAVVRMERSVLPVLGRDVYHLGPAVTLSFLISFGLAKAPLNLVAGTLSDDIGRHRVLIAGWLLGFPMMALLLGVEHWWAVVLANVFVGANQALAWTMTVNMQMDLAGPRQRGLAMGINEATGYTGVALATMATGFIAARFGVRQAPFLFGSAVVVIGLLLSIVVTRETRHLVVDKAPLPQPHRRPRHRLVRCFAGPPCAILPSPPRPSGDSSISWRTLWRGAPCLGTWPLVVCRSPKSEWWRAPTR